MYATRLLVLGLLLSSAPSVGATTSAPSAANMALATAAEPPAADPVPAEIEEVQAATPTHAEAQILQRESGSGVLAPSDDVVVARQDVSGFGTVGVTWNGPTAPAGVIVKARTLADDVASEWTALEIEEGPADSPTGGTAPLVVGEVDHVEVVVEHARSAGLSDVQLVVIDPGRSAVDEQASGVPTTTSPNGRSATSGTIPAVPTATPGSSGGPAFHSRAEWGADESQMTWRARQGDFKGAIIHHTAGTNDYTPEQVPEILRGIYAYHAVTRGWGDIGYNFLIDKWGRIWEGRAGGGELETIGAHTQNYNTNTVGVSVLGNYQEATVSNAAVDAIVRLLGWKLSLHGVDAAGRMTLNGNNLPTIIGHRDVASTSCPGQSLWIRQDEIRSRVKAEQAKYTGIFATGTGSFVKSPVRAEVYLVSGTTKSHVTSWPVYESLSRLGRISDASDVYLNFLSNGPELRRAVRDSASGDVSFVDGNRLYHFTSCAQVSHFGARCAYGYVNLTSSQWSSLSKAGNLSRAVKPSNDSRVYWMENGRKRWVTTWAALQRLTGQGSPTVTTLSPSAIAEFATGSNYS